ncbi:MAG: hypothetical protein COB66_05165 [Coxiella sp. (in: Bacteria)]|nr:MAG: hypothetical protein COB66_05165 [Coxiella sp. (in: g-proteobacteria)]
MNKKRLKWIRRQIKPRNLTVAGTQHLKNSFAEETFRAGNSVSCIARQNGITPSLLYKWRLAMEDGSLTGIDCKDGIAPKK